MYDTSPLAPFKGEPKPFLHVGLDTKTLESLFDLHPSFETSLDFSDYLTGMTAVGGGGGAAAVVAATVTSPPGIRDSAVVTSPVPSSPADFPSVTLSCAATSQHLAEIERRHSSSSTSTTAPGCGGSGTGTPPALGNPTAAAGGIPPVCSSSSSVNNNNSGSNNNNSVISSSSSSSIGAPPGHHHPHPHHPHQHHHHHHPSPHPHHHHHHHSGSVSTGAPTTHFLNQPVSQQQMSPGGAGSVPSTPSPVSHHPPPPHPFSHHHPHSHHSQHHGAQHHPQGYPQGPYPQPVLSPSLTADDVSQAFSDDSCVFMPEYEQLTTVTSIPGRGTTAPPATSGRGMMEEAGAGGWGLPRDPFYGSVKTEDMGLASLTACSLETNLPGFTPSSTLITTASTSSPSFSATTKMEFDASALGGAVGGLGVLGGAHYSGALTVSVSPSRSMRTLSESSTGTVSTLPDSPGGSCSRGSSRGGSGGGGRSGSGDPCPGGSGLGKGGSSRRRQVPKGSEEYKEKRARNNVAVRKSRAKAKQKQRHTEGRVKELTDHNETLQKKVDTLTKELTVLRRLFVDVGNPLPDDLSKLMPQS